jgi:hypothetical protein
MAEPVTPLDPLSLAIGRIEGRLDGIERELAELRAAFWRGFGSLATLIIIGFAALGWLVRQHG